MKFSKEFVAKAVAGSRAETKELAPVIRRCAGAGVAKSKTPVAVEDIEQELWLFLFQHYERLDEDFNIEPYLIETARNLALGFNRKFSMYGTVGTEDVRADGLVDMAGREVDSEDEATTDLIGRTGQEQALASLMKVSKALRAAANDDVEQGTELMRKKADKVTKLPHRTLTAEHRELRTIRNEVKLSQAEMAMRLGCKLTTYQSYEYGKTETVNAKVLEAARKLRVNPEFNYVDALYKRKSMATVAAGWASRLGIELEKDGGVTALAQVLGVDKATVSRWIAPMSNVTPTVDSLAIYERRVNAEERYRAEHPNRFLVG